MTVQSASMCVYAYRHTQSTYIYEQDKYFLNSKLKTRCSYKSKGCLDTKIHCSSSRQNYRTVTTERPDVHHIYNHNYWQAAVYFMSLAFNLGLDEVWVAITSSSNVTH